MKPMKRLVVITAALLASTSAAAQPTAEPRGVVWVGDAHVEGLTTSCEARGCLESRRVRFRVMSGTSPVSVQVLTVAHRRRDTDRWRRLRIAAVAPEGATPDRRRAFDVPPHETQAFDVHHAAIPLAEDAVERYRVVLRVDGRRVVLAAGVVAHRASSEVVSGCW